MDTINLEPVFDFLMSLAPWVSYVLIGLGTLVVVGTGVDKVIPDEYDKGFMKFVLGIPVLGVLLKAVAKFSPFHVKD